MDCVRYINSYGVPKNNNKAITVKPIGRGAIFSKYINYNLTYLYVIVMLFFSVYIFKYYVQNNLSTTFLFSVETNHLSFVDNGFVDSIYVCKAIIKGD